MYATFELSAQRPSWLVALSQTSDKGTQNQNTRSASGSQDKTKGIR